jgi:hypothetical protein
LRGKCTQRNFWIGDSIVESWFGLTLPSLSGNAMRFFKAKNFVPPGSLYSMAKPTKSRGGLPFFQFIPSSAMPSPRWIFSVNSAAAFVPST